MHDLPKRLTQDEAFDAAVSTLATYYPNAMETIYAYMEYVVEYACAQRVPAFPTIWDAGQREFTVRCFERWSFATATMTREHWAAHLRTLGM